MRTGDNVQKNEIQAEYSVIGALLLDNDSIDRIIDLQTEHFYNYENRLYFAEIIRQIAQGGRVDVITVFDKLKDQITDCLISLNTIANTVGSSSNITRYAEIIINSAIKRSLVALGREIEDIVTTEKESGVCVDLVASKVEQLGQRKTSQEPQRFDSLLGNYVATMEDRQSGKIKPVSTGYASMDAKLGGGLERGTLTVVAGRPAMGKTAYGLGLARNMAEEGSSLFLSMEMTKEQVCDRNISALGGIPIAWLRAPKDELSSDKEQWDNLTKAFAKSQSLNLYIDDQTSLNMLAIRNKARQVKRKAGLDALVIDQLSFITGAQSDQLRLAIGEYTRALLQIAKELNIAVVLLCQLNRDCEKRPNKRPQMSDLAESGSIEQDAATIIFLYRDEVYNEDSKDKGICEVIIGKQRQGSTGIVPMCYIADQTRFECLARPWERPQYDAKKKGLAASL